MKAISSLISLVFLGVSIAACQPLPVPLTIAPATETPPAVAGRVGARITLVATWTPTATSVPTHTRTAAPSPSSTPTPTPRPTRSPELGPELAPRTEITAFDLMSPSHNLLHDLIIFISDSPSPFLLPNIGQSADQVGVHLWAFSPDGSRAGRLTPSGLGFASYQSPDPGARPIFVQYGIYFNHPLIQPVTPPEECNLVPCTNFRFSPDGRFLTMNLDISGWNVLVMDTLSGAYVYLPPDGAEKVYQFLPDGRMLVFALYGESGEVFLYNPASQTSLRLGATGQTVWNPQQTAFAVAVTPYEGVGGFVWGFNLETEGIFMGEPASISGIDRRLVWAPGGQYVLYQHRSLTFDGKNYAFNGSQKIVIVDAFSGKRDLLLGDETHDFSFTPTGVTDESLWRGDWVQVQRIPFEPQSIPWSRDFFHDPRVICLIYGLNCSGIELFALNWRSGEIVPWDEAPLPTVTPTASVMPSSFYGPNLSNPPVYQHPQGYYAFYVGTDGVSLWMVPQQGNPELWVINGKDFLYLP